MKGADLGTLDCPFHPSPPPPNKEDHFITEITKRASTSQYPKIVQNNWPASSAKKASVQQYQSDNRISAHKRIKGATFSVNYNFTNSTGVPISMSGDGKTQGHHIITCESMEGSDFELWADASKGRITHNIGYSINNAMNMVMLPSDLGSITATHADGRHARSPGREAMIRLLMYKLELQWHRGGHGGTSSAHKIGAFTSGDKSAWVLSQSDAIKMKMANFKKTKPERLSYAMECRNRCNLVGLGVLLTAGSSGCGEKDCGLATINNTEKKYPPPYKLFEWINLESRDMLCCSSGPPTTWSTFISKRAREFHTRCTSHQSWHDAVFKSNTSPT